MGITIHQSPSGYASAHEEVWHVVESTDKAIAGFQYVFDIYKDATLLTRVKNSPLGANSYGVLDVGNIVRSSLDSYNFPQLIMDEFVSPVTLGADVFFTDYDIRYGQATGLTEVSGNLASGTYRVYNNYKRSRWDKRASEIEDNHILSNRQEINWYDGEPVVLTVNWDTGSGSNAFDFTITRTGLSNYVDEILTNVSGVYVYAFIPPDKADLLAVYSSASGYTGTLNFYKKCAKYETHTLVFLNAFGGYDSFTFVHGKLMMSNEKKKFEQQRWVLSGTSMVEKSGDVYNESMKAYAVKYKERMMLTSDILSTGEYNWLSELINSPQVYYYSTENQEYYPVHITDSDYEFKDDRINKAETLSITIEFSTPQNTQYR
jgi:hypothetical protein